MYSTSPSCAIATSWNKSDRSPTEIALDLKPIVAKRIAIERIGITRNSSSTPYLVYLVGDRRCCTFFKRKVLWQLIEEFLKIRYNIEEKVRSIVSTNTFDLDVLIGESWRILFRPHVIRFVERWNNRFENLKSSPVPAVSGYIIGARSAKACARNAKVVEMHRQRQALVSPEVEKIVAAMRSAIALQNWEILCEALFDNEQYKTAAWEQLSSLEQQKLAVLTPVEVKILEEAQDNRKIAAFTEDSVGGIFYIWTTLASTPVMLSGSAVAKFLRQLEEALIAPVSS